MRKNSLQTKIRLFRFKIALPPQPILLQGQYCNCPPQIVLKFSVLQDSDMERYPSPKLAIEIHFYYPKIALNLEQKICIRYNLKPIIICRTSKSGALLGFCDISSRFQYIGNFSCFHIFVPFLTWFLW